MPSVGAPRMWTPRSYTKSKNQPGNAGQSLLGNRELTFRPKTKGWKTPKEMKPEAVHNRSPRVLTNAMANDLIAEAEKWDAEAERLATQPMRRKMHPYFSDVERELGRCLLKISPKRSKVEAHVVAWDRGRDGAVSKGEFRIHVKQLGIQVENVYEIDELYDHYDIDHSGIIEVEELKVVLGQLHKRCMENAIAFAQMQKATDGSSTVGMDSITQQKVERLRLRAKAARDAAETRRLIEVAEEELQQLKDMIEGTIHVQLGALLVRRGIKIGEILGTWIGPRGKHEQSHTRELKKSEFKDEVTRLGLKIKDTLVDPKVIGQLFDEIDTDKSGYLDLKEVKAALKKWQGWSDEAYSEQKTKEGELSKLRAFAARKMQEAFKPPELKLPDVEDMELPDAVPSPEGGEEEELSPVVESQPAHRGSSRTETSTERSSGRFSSVRKMAASAASAVLPGKTSAKGEPPSTRESTTRESVRSDSSMPTPKDAMAAKAAKAAEVKAKAEAKAAEEAASAAKAAAIARAAEEQRAAEEAEEAEAEKAAAEARAAASAEAAAEAEAKATARSKAVAEAKAAMEAKEAAMAARAAESRARAAAEAKVKAEAAAEEAEAAEAARQEAKVHAEAEERRRKEAKAKAIAEARGGDSQREPAPLPPKQGGICNSFAGPLELCWAFTVILRE